MTVQPIASPATRPRAAPVAATPGPASAPVPAGPGDAQSHRHWPAVAVAPSRIALALTVALAAAWAALFSCLAIVRDLAGGTHAEDLGFTDQVLWNFLHGQWFRMSIYNAATWNTELDLSRIARPDSLLAFHVEPMLLLLVPLYAAGGGMLSLLALQAIAVAAGAVPAFRLGRYLANSPLCGLAVASAYVLSPLGQWAVLADFHTSTLAASLLLFSLERLVVARAPLQALLFAALAASAREDIGPVLAMLGLTVLLRPGLVRRGNAGDSRAWPAAHRRALPWQPSPAPLDTHATSLSAGALQSLNRLWRHISLHRRRTATSLPPGAPAGPALPTLAWRRITSPARGIAIAYLGLGLASTLISLLVLRHYSGGISPFDVRYGAALGGGAASILEALTRPAVLGYATSLLLSGGWLGLFAPLALLPAAPSLVLNALSSSDWMAAGKAHYSGLVLPFITVSAAAGLATLRGHTRVQRAAAVALVATSLVGYVEAGAGPLGANYAPAALSPHSERAAAIARALPADAAISASTALVPRLSSRAHIYVFPTVLDAEYVFLDLQSTSAPTSAGDVYLRTQALLTSGDWRLITADDGLLVLQRTSESANTILPAPDGVPAPDSTMATKTAHVASNNSAAAPGPDGAMATTAHVASNNSAAAPGPDTAPSASDQRISEPRLVSAALVPAPDGALGVDGPRWILHTVWTLDQPLPSNTRMDFWVNLSSGERLHLWDIADVWWNPPDHWPVGQPVAIDVPDIPVRTFVSWSATWRAD